MTYSAAAHSRPSCVQQDGTKVLSVADLRDSVPGFKDSHRSAATESSGHTRDSDELKAGGFVSGFIEVETPEEDAAPMFPVLAKALYSSFTEAAICGLIMVNFVTICLESDAKAAHVEAPVWAPPLSHIIYLVFVIELVIRMLVEQKDIVGNPWNWLDATIVGFGFLDYVLQWSGGVEIIDLGVIRVTRLCRLFRVLRVVFRFSFFRELRKFMQMLGSSFMTLWWALILMWMFITVWAIIAVELINPIVQRLADDGTWGGCDRCRHSFSSIFAATVTFFQTVIAGDSWGYIAVPVIEASPWTSIVFLGAFFTLIFGVVNLAMAVLVETFAENRSKDMNNRAREMDCDEINEKKMLSKIFNQIDENSDGTLSWDELHEGARKVAEFRHWLRVLDIDAADLFQLFQMVDADGSGEIDPQEFIDAMYRMKNTESRTATRFVKHLVTQMGARQVFIEDKLVELHECTENSIKSTLMEHADGIQRSIEQTLQKAAQAAIEATLLDVTRKGS